MLRIAIKNTTKYLVASYNCNTSSSVCLCAYNNNMSIVAAFGNPLLDISVRIPNADILQKFQLKEDGQSDVAEAEIQLLYSEIEKLERFESAGGCAQNTARVLQWMLGQPGATVFFGGIGNDKQGRLLEKLVQDAGVQTKYLVNEKSTGTCIALVKNATRTLVAHLGAAEYFSQTEFNSHYLHILQSVKICYMEGYFITKRIQVAQYIQNYCRENQITFVFNLSGAYLFKQYGQELVDFAQRCDMLFGNFAEFSELGKILNINHPKDVASKLNHQYSQTNHCELGKTVVVTNGAEKVLCVSKNGETLEMDVPGVPVGEIRDTTGAGDSFVAGFLAGWVRGFAVEECVKLATWCSAQVIRQVGCNVPQCQPNLKDILENWL